MDMWIQVAPFLIYVAPFYGTINYDVLLPMYYHVLVRETSLKTSLMVPPKKKMVSKRGGILIEVYRNSVVKIMNEIF